MICLDSTVFVDLRRTRDVGRKMRAAAVLRDALAKGEHPSTTRFNVAELYVGIHLSNHPDEERQRVQEAISGIQILEFDNTAAEVYGYLRSELRRIGKPAGDLDTLIASVALSNGAALVTRNPKHFAHMPGLTIFDYGT